nr:MAG TPA: hypothetical protein [Caudoviricetes sp.]
MKQQRFPQTMINQNKNSFAEPLKGSVKYLAAILTALIIVLTVFAGITALRPALANTDWHDNDVSEQISKETRCELRGGVYENNVCLPPNLTAEGEKQASAYLIIKQAEINKEFK